MTTVSQCFIPTHGFELLGFVDDDDDFLCKFLQPSRASIALQYDIFRLSTVKPCVFAKLVIIRFL